MIKTDSLLFKGLVRAGMKRIELRNRAVIRNDLKCPGLGQRYQVTARIAVQTEFPLACRVFDNDQAQEAFAAHSELGVFCKAQASLGRPSYTQQVALEICGKLPTFVTIIGPTEAEAKRAGIEHFYFRELVKNIITNGFWTRGVLGNYYMDLRDLRDPKIYVSDPQPQLLGMNSIEKAKLAGVNARVYRDRKLEDIFGANMPDRLNSYGEHVEKEISKRNEMLENISGEPFFSQWLHMTRYAAVASRRNHHKYIVASGDIGNSEVNAFVSEFEKDKRFVRFYSDYGNIFIKFNRDSVDIHTEKAVSEGDLERLRGFIDGFRRCYYISDLHLATKGPEDNFGEGKEEDMLALLDEVIRCRSTLFINGDLLDLWKAKYSKIRDAYPRLFEKLKNVRRVIYIAGNHDEAILQEKYHTADITALALAQSGQLSGCVEYDGVSKAFIRRGEGAANDKLLKLLNDVRQIPTMQKLIEKAESMRETNDNSLPASTVRFRLSSDFSLKGFIYDEGSGTFYVDEKVLTENDASGILFGMINDSLQELGECITSEFHNIQIRPYYLDWRMGIFVQHGHQADVPNYHSRVGRFITAALGLIERAHRGTLPRSFEQDIEGMGVFPQALFPDMFWPELKYLQRNIGLCNMLKWYIAARDNEGCAVPIIISGHTHEEQMYGGLSWAYHVMTGGGWAPNTGSWSGVHLINMTRKNIWKKNGNGNKEYDLDKELGRENVIIGTGRDLTLTDRKIVIADSRFPPANMAECQKI